MTLVHATLANQINQELLVKQKARIQFLKQHYPKPVNVKEYLTIFIMEKKEAFFNSESVDFPQIVMVVYDHWEYSGEDWKTLQSEAMLLGFDVSSEGRSGEKGGNLILRLPKIN